MIRENNALGTKESFKKELKTRANIRETLSKTTKRNQAQYSNPRIGEKEECTVSPSDGFEERSGIRAN